MDDETHAAIDLATDEDEQLLREALEALEGCRSYIIGTITVHEGESDREGINRVRNKLLHHSRAAITKLEQRLLEE